MPFSAVLLAAGHSTRMGRDKALLEVDGTALWARQRDVLARAGAAEIFLSARPGQPWTRGVTGFTAVVQDSWPNSGPLAGLTAGLERASHPHVAVLAIDLPRISAAWFATLLADCSPGVGVVGRYGEFFEPLAAVYPREMRWLAGEALARGELSLQHLLKAGVAQGRLRVRNLTDLEIALFENWNEPDRGSE